MSAERDRIEQEIAMQNPVAAMKSLRVTPETCESTLQNVFLREYIKVQGRNTQNTIVLSNVDAAVRDWKIDKEIPHWLARACVLASREIA